MAVVSEYKIEGRTQRLLVVNLHAPNFVTTHVFASQVRQIEAWIVGHAGPILVAGDFNSWSPGRRSVVTEAARRHGLLPVYEGDPRRPLSNYFFFTQAFVRGLEVVSATFLGENDASDHQALSYELRVAEGEWDLANSASDDRP